LSENLTVEIGDDGYEVKPSLPVMSRGLSQVLFNYLPERTFDYDRGACIAKVFELRMQEVKGIDVERLSATIQRYVERWGERVDDFDVKRSHLLLFGRPLRVLFNLFPLTFQCGTCDRVKNFENEDSFVKVGGIGACAHCGPKARFEQIYHVLVHECGHMSGLLPRRCPRCHAVEHIALDLRGSQQARDFRWLCKACGVPSGPVQRPCPRCLAATGEDDGSAERPAAMMRVIPHRANNSYYPHSVTILNLPTQQTAMLATHPLRDKVLAKAVVEERYDLDTLLHAAARSGPDSTSGLDDITALLDLVPESERGELARSLERVAALRHEKARQESASIASSTDTITEGGWLEALEYLNLHTLGRLTQDQLRHEIEARHPGRGALVDRYIELAAAIGISDIQLIQNFPVVTAVFGFTRVSFEPQSRLVDKDVLTRFQGFATPRSGPKDQSRRRPIFVDDSSTEALLFKLSPRTVVRWLRRRGRTVPEAALQSDQASRAWLLGEVEEVDTFVTLRNSPGVTRDLFTLVHTFAHMVVRALARLSGIDRTSLAEYLFPRIAAFAIYNTKAGSNLGGLHTVFSEMQEELLKTLGQDVFLRTCVYDPVCSTERAGSCHACTHLPEMCCKHYNRGLSRSILFNPAFAGDDLVGFWASV
jgi:hypothetical protein